MADRTKARPQDTGSESGRGWTDDPWTALGGPPVRYLVLEFASEQSRSRPGSASLVYGRAAAWPGAGREGRYVPCAVAAREAPPSPRGPRASCAPPGALVPRSPPPPALGCELAHSVWGRRDASSQVGGRHKERAFWVGQGLPRTSCRHSRKGVG